MRVLGIETSCDETGIALLEGETADGELHARALGEALFSQAELHQPHGGVVPELAARDHIVRLTPMLEQAVGAHRLSDLDAVAYTAGPGLIGPLMTGAVFAHGLAMALEIPALGVHHLEAHLLSPRLSAPQEMPNFPFVALLVSGGHTALFLVNGIGRYELLGQTLDDAAGEAFDKTARLLDLGYPGGPAIAALAQRGRAGRYELPRPMLQRAGLDFSFSGLKTHAATLFRDAHIARDEQARADFALAFEEAITATLAAKCQRALKQTGARNLVVAGGVSANHRLRAKLGELRGARALFPEHHLCTDNGLMIAYAGFARLALGERASEFPDVRPRWPLAELTPPSAEAPNAPSGELPGELSVG